VLKHTSQKLGQTSLSICRRYAYELHAIQATVVPGFFPNRLYAQFLHENIFPNSLQLSTTYRYIRKKQVSTNRGVPIAF
jgi:hypothetical protein